MVNIRLVPRRHARNTARIRGARATHQTKHEAGQASTATILRTQAQSNGGGSQPITRRPVHPRNKEDHLDSQPSAGTKERYGRTANVSRLRASQQALPKGSLPPA